MRRVEVLNESRTARRSLTVFCGGGERAERAAASERLASVRPGEAAASSHREGIEARKWFDGLACPATRFPKVSFSIAVAGGYTADPKDLPGLSDLISATIDQGTKSRNARQIAEALQSAGGDLSANAGKEGFYITSSVLSSKSADGLSVLADVLQNAAFPDNEVALAKRNLASSLEAQEANPQFLASRAMAKVLYGDSPYSVISATKESLAAMAPANLRSEYARRFRPDRALVVVVGDFSADKMLATIKEKFDAWRSPEEAAISVPPPSDAGPEHAIFFISRADS